jgi:hypothetical protein
MEQKLKPLLVWSQIMVKKAMFTDPNHQFACLLFDGSVVTNQEIPTRFCH